MERDTIVRLALPGSSVADDPLLLVLRDDARRTLQQVIQAEIRRFYERTPSSRTRMAGGVSSVTGTHPNAQTGIGSISCAGRSFEIAAMAPTASRSASARRCCRHCGGRRTSRIS